MKAINTNKITGTALSFENMKVNLFSLSFAGDFAAYESEFHQRYLEKSLKPLRYAIIFAILTWTPFGLLDAYLDPDHLKTLWLIRYGIVTPLMLFGFFFTYHPLFHKYMQPFIAVSILVCGAGIIMMIPIATTPMRHSYYAGFFLIMMFAYTILRLRFIWAAITCWLLVLMYEIMAIKIQTPVRVLLSNNFFFIGGNVIGMFACYSIELYNRKDFFLAKQLEFEKERVAQANRELEQSVRERTSQLIKINEDLNLTISEQKKTEKNLQKSEEKYRTILTNIEEGYYEIDLTGNFTFFNESVLKIYNCRKEELHEKNIRDFMSEGNASEVLKIYNEIYQTKISVTDMNWEIETGQGAQRFLEVSATRIDDERGKPIGFRGIIRDITGRKKMEKKLIDSYKNIKETRAMTILGLAKLAEYRDQNTGEHLERMMEYTKLLARALSKKQKYQDYITEEYIEDVYISSMLHDIGKVGITDRILLKPGPLDDDEYEKVKKHTLLGGDALRAVEAQIKGKSFLSLGKQICYYHHERWDGTGYPFGLSGKNIPLSARIVALADVYDALTSERVYKSASSHETAVATIQKEKGRHFDPDIVEIFLENQEAFLHILENGTIRVAMQEGYVPEALA